MYPSSAIKTASCVNVTWQQIKKKETSGKVDGIRNQRTRDSDHARNLAIAKHAEVVEALKEYVDYVQCLHFFKSFLANLFSMIFAGCLSSLSASRCDCNQEENNENF